MMRIFRRDVRICPTETYYSDMAGRGKIKINKNNDMCTVAAGGTSLTLRTAPVLSAGPTNGAFPERPGGQGGSLGKKLVFAAEFASNAKPASRHKAPFFPHNNQLSLINNHLTDPLCPPWLIRKFHLTPNLSQCIIPIKLNNLKCLILNTQPHQETQYPKSNAI
jgi:hypothetical protein